MNEPLRLEDVPADFEQREYRWKLAPRVPRDLNIALRLMQLPRVGRFFASHVLRRFRQSDEASVMPGFRCFYGNLLLGHRVSLCDSFCLDYAPIVCYDYVAFSWKNMLLTSSHDLNEMDVITARPIVLERNVWVTSGCIILGGVRIGENTVVAAGSVVTRSLPPNVLAGGNPARPIKTIERKVSF
jgi:maltose O-acetyltransferase